MTTNSMTNICSGLIWSQTLARPKNGIPPDALTCSKLDDVKATWMQDFSAIELSCIKLRINHWKSIINKTPTPFNEEQQSILKKMRNLSKGIYSKQLNGFRLLFPRLCIHFLVIDSWNKALTIKETNKVKNFVENVNSKFTMIFSLLEQAIELKEFNQIIINEIERVINIAFNLFSNMPCFLRKNKEMFKKQKKYLKLFNHCLGNVKELLPILFIPCDKYAILYHKESPLLTAYFTENKQNCLLAAINLVKVSCEQVTQKCKAIKNRSLRSFPSLLTQYQELKKKWFEFSYSLQMKIDEFISLISSKTLLNLETKARNGDQQIIFEFEKKISELREFINAFCEFNVENLPFKEFQKYIEIFATNKNDCKLKEKLKIETIVKEFTQLLTTYNFMPSIHLLLLHIDIIKPIAVDLSSSAEWIKTHHDSFPSTRNAFVRPIDVLIQKNLTRIFQKQIYKNPDVNSQKEAINSLLSFGVDFIIGMDSFARKGITPTFKIAGENLVKLISKISNNLNALNISSSCFIDLDIFAKKQPIKNLKIGLPHLYPYLNQGIGNQLIIDPPALKFLQLSIKLNHEILSRLKVLSNHCFSKLGKNPYPELVLYHKSLCEFINRANTILDLPCTSEKEAKKLSLELYELVINHFPTFNTTFIENIYKENTPSQEVSDFINTIYASLESAKTCPFRLILEIGQIAYLEEEPTPKKNAPPKKTFFKPHKIKEQLSPQTVQVSAAPSTKHTYTPQQAIDVVKINAQHLPVKIHDELNQDSCVMESNKHNLICHLENLSELLSATPLSPLATAEALQRENALALESVLSYFFAKFKIKSEEKSLWQHNLDQMAKMLPSLKFFSDDISLLKSLSPMLSNASRLHLYPSNTRIAFILKMKNNPENALMRASEETIQVLTLIQKIIGGKKIPEMVFSAPAFPAKNVHPIHTKACSQLQKNLSKKHKLSLMRVESMSPNWQALLRELQMTHMLKDLPYHFSMIDEIFNQAQNKDALLCPALLSSNFYHLGHALEKCLKLSILYIGIPSEINPHNHAAFDSINGRLRVYDHNLMRNLELLNQGDFKLSKEERAAIDKLSDFSIFTRYPAGQKGALPALLGKATLLYQMRDGFFTTDLGKTAKKMFGSDQSEWAGKARNELMRIQTEEFLPLVKTLLKVGEKLLAFALEIRKSLPLTG